ncbi:MAG TPA: metal-sensitive transcriptional regulator [Nocardioides sp.]|jgi:CsoR family transcriptional regulator, copper-sensing transcriptional repressor|uniref:metal-sensitive transcriptional regulator n=1 Tax=Nocardioides sp. TaxID=35761 RepID=UPI002C4977B1|nr:metal-sensitive transcriptional regulator [Nocardioides sp.]HTW17593.1 metal-sensitive transcriptional regulator [Nocardioides sp.]
MEQESGHQHGYIHRKDDYLKRLRRIEGQARGLQRMVEEEKYCIDILTQVAAMTKALQAVSLGLLEEHMNHCVVDAARAGDAEGRAKVAEAVEAITRLVRS